MGEEQKEKVSAGGTEQVDQQTSGTSGDQSQTQQAPEFWLDEDGELQGNFADWTVEGTGEEQKEPEHRDVKEQEKQEEAKEEEQQIQYYTPEELASLELHQIDPNRLPEELKPYYQAMLRQALAQKQADQTPTQPQLDEKEMLEVIKREARQRVEQKLGEQFDEMNPDHLTALAVEASRLAQIYDRRRKAQQKIAEIRATEPFFDQIEQFAQQKLLELPAKEYLRLSKAMENGDIHTLMPFWEQCRREFYEQRLGRKLASEPKEQEKKPSPKPAPQPPKVESAGKGEVASQPQIRPRDFANMTEEEQVEALIKMGLVEKP